MSNTKKNKIKRAAAVKAQAEQTRRWPLVILRGALTKVETQGWTGSKKDHEAQIMLMDAIRYLESFMDYGDPKYVSRAVRRMMDQAGYEG